MRKPEQPNHSLDAQVQQAQRRTVQYWFEDGIGGGGGLDGVCPALSDLTPVDRIIHEPARLLIVTLLYAVETAEFLFLLRESGLSKGNLSSHLSKLETAGYVAIEKTFRGKIPLTICRLTETGREAFRTYRDRLKRVVDTLPE